MNETPSGPDPITKPDSDDLDQARRPGALPTWPWLLVIVVLLVVVAILATMLIVRPNGETATTSSPGTSQSTLPTPSTTSESATPTATEPADANAKRPFDSDMKDRIADILNSQNTAVFGDLFSNPVEVIVLGGQDSFMSPDEATMAISFMFTPDDPYAWDLDLTDDYLNVYRAHYPDLFPTRAIVAKSHNKAVFSFIGHGSTITTVVAVASEGALG